MLAAFFDGKEPDEATLKRLIRKAVITGAFFPVLCGSAFKNKGVQTLLDAVVDYLPSPLDVPPIKGIDVQTGEEVVRLPSDDEPLAMLAFKIMDDPFVGSLTFCRIYSGKLEAGQQLLNSPRDRKERVGRMLLMHANHREDIKEAFAGDIVALVGLKDTRTGDTLCDPQKPVILERMEFPEPVIEIAVEPKSKADQEKLGVALSRLAAEDPSFRVSTDQECGQTIIKGMGELHLDIKVDILKRDLQGRRQRRRAAGRLSRDDHQAARRTTTRTRSRSGGSGQFAARRARVEPSGAGVGFEFEYEGRRRLGAEGIRPGRREGRRVGHDLRPARRLPGGRRQRSRWSTARTTTSTPRRSPSRSRRARLPRGAQDGRSGAARADHEGRGGEPRGLCRLGHRRPQLAARPDQRHRHARQRAGRQRDGAARQHVRLRQQAALDEPGTRPVHDAVRPLRAGAAAQVAEEIQAKYA